MRDMSAQYGPVYEAERYWRKDITQRSVSVLLPPELRYLSSAIALTRVVVSAFEERIELRDVSAPGYDTLTDRLRRWRRLNDLDELFTFNTLEALITGRSYISVSGGDDGPTFAVETAHGMVHATDPRTRAVTELLRVWRDGEGRQHAVWYRPNRTDYLIQADSGRWSPDPDVPDPVVEHGFGRPTVVPFLNRARVAETWGQPEAKPVHSLQEDMSRCLTDLAAACALMAVPQRAVFGVDERDLKDPATGEDIPAAQLYMSRLLTIADAGGRIAEFAAAQLSQFTSTLVSYARLASAVSGVPIAYFGVASEANPASGDAQRADDDRLVKRARRIARGFTRPAREVFRLAAEMDGETNKEALAAIDVRWADPAMITVGQKADYVSKLAAIKTDPEMLLTPEYLLDILDLTPDQIADMVNRESSTLTTLIDQLQREPGNASTTPETVPAPAAT